MNDELRCHPDPTAWAQCEQRRKPCGRTLPWQRLSGLSPRPAPATINAGVNSAHRCLFQIQPMLPRHKSLLRTAVCALLMSQGFKLLTRIAVALSGERIRVVLWLGRRPASRHRSQDEVQETIFTIDPRWLAQLSVDDPFLQGWCNALASGRASYGGRPTAKPCPAQSRAV